MGVGCCTRCWTRQNTPRPLRGPLQRTCGPRTARGAALESLAAPLAPEKCVSTPKLRARSAALSKLIVRTEQNNFAGGGTVAGLVLWAPVAARRDEVRAGACGTNASGAENAPRYSVQDVGDSPKLPEAAPRRSPESWGGAERSAEPRGEVSRRRRCPHSVCGGRGAVGGGTVTSSALRGRKWGF